MVAELFLPTFLAGVLTFLAPCTLPLLPGFLGFLAGGVNPKDLGSAGRDLRWQLTKNALAYVAGFSLVFIALGTVFAAGGEVLLNARDILGRLGGLLVTFLGLYMLGVVRFPLLEQERRIRLMGLTPGRTVSSFLLGVTFSLGWSPCVGPILGAVLTLAATRATVDEGALLLLVFSAGLAVPFLLSALLAGTALEYLRRASRFLYALNLLGGAFLVLVGLLLLFGQFGVWVSFFYRLFNYGGFVNYL